MKKVVTIFHIVLFSVYGFAQNSIKDVPFETIQIHLPFADSIYSSPHPKAIKLNKTDWKLFDFEKLEEYQPSFQYFIYGNFKINGLNLVLVGRAYEEESLHWACLYDADFRMLDTLRISYDNSEGFLSVDSKIDSAAVTVSEWNLYNDPQEAKKKYTITPNGFKLE